MDISENGWQIAEKLLILLNDTQRQEFHDINMLEACRDVIVIRGECQPNVYSHRNRYMKEHSARVIAVYDGREKGGTVRTIRSNTK